MNLRHIEVFREVYLAGSVSGAARALNVSQPSVSKVLRHAESRIGFTLFRRLKGRLAPTDEAHALFREVDELYGRVHSLRQTALNLKRAGEGHLRLAVLPSLGLGVAPAAIAAFRRQHPRVSFDVRTLHHSEILRSLHERECDLAVGFEVTPHPRLTVVEIGAGEVGVLYREEDMPAAPPSIDLSVLDGRTVIGMVGSGPVGVLLSQEVESRGLDLNEAISVHTYYVAAALVRFGAGFAAVDEYTARASLEPGLSFRPLSPPVRFRVQYAHLDDRPLSTIAQAFVRLMGEALQGEVIA
jgi:DNA-binding transcriptional LysR family regulator